MKLMDKYLLREYLIHVAYCLLLFCMIYVVFDLFSHLTSFLDARISFRTIVFYYVCLMTPTLEYLLPASLLLATLYTLWYLTKNNEFTAMRASGISLFRIMMPFLGVGVLFTLLTAGIKETVGPQVGHWAKEFSDSKFRNSKETVYREVAYFSKITRRQWLIGEIDPRLPNRLVDVKIKQERLDGSTSEELTAKRAEWVNGQWWFFGLTVQKYDKDDNPVKIQKPKESELNTPRPIGYLTELPSDFFNEVKPPEFLTSLELARFIASHKELSKRTIAQKRFDLHSRLAMPWACVIVTLFGIPAGARGGRQSALTGIFLAMAFFFGFYALTHIGMFLGKREIVAPWLGAWLSNIVFLTAGVLMMFRLK
jgi:lipopolysaccharide export system permease protein